MIRIAIPVMDNEFQSKLSLTFSRSSYFAIWEKESEKIEFIPNPYYLNSIGAGGNVFELLTARMRVNTFLAYELGLKVQQMAVKNKIQLIIINNRNQTLSDIYKLTKD